MPLAPLLPARGEKAGMRGEAEDSARSPQRGEGWPSKASRKHLASPDDRQREPIPALGADGLDRRRLQARLARHHLEHAARADHVRILG